VLTVENLTKVYASGVAGGGIRDVSFDVAAGEFYTLLGPSGCGKTTTLRSIAGLEEPTGGRMVLGNRLIFDAGKGAFIPANQRELGMVFQSYAVWPHMTVFDNTAFPLKMSHERKWSSKEIHERVTRTLETMGLGAFAARSAAQLSGGQQQRLALARALVAEPRLLLLDEPLSNLDALLREQMRNELRRLQKEVGVTAIYVTHDQSEALALSDRIAIMQNGRIVQIGTPRDIYYKPADAFVASFVGRSNLLRGTVREQSKDGIRIETALGPVLCQAPHAPTAPSPGAAMIRPEDVVLYPAGVDGAGVNRFRGSIVQAVFLGEATEYVVKVGEVDIVVRNIADKQLEPGPVEVFFPPDKMLAVIVT
jgi:iron(III) transport system ATP-binding protein